MTVPYNNETRERYIERMKDSHLWMARSLHEFGQKYSVWLQLFNWVRADEIYGEHWDTLQEKNNE
jgi:hypothetical protein